MALTYNINIIHAGSTYIEYIYVRPRRSLACSMQIRLDPSFFGAAAFQLAFGSVIRLNVSEPKRLQKGVLGNPRLSGFGRWWLSVYPGRGVVRRRHEEQALTR